MKTHYKMKKILFIALAFVIAACSTSDPNGYKITGFINENVEGDFNGSKALLLEFSNNQYEIIDTADVVDNQFVFEGTLANGPFEGCVRMDNLMGRTDIFIEADDYTIEINDNMLNAIVRGGETQNLITELQLLNEKLKSEYKITTILNQIENGSDDEVTIGLSIFKSYKDELEAKSDSIKAQYPLSYYDLKKAVEKIEFLPLDSLERSLEVFVNDPKFANSGYLNNILADIAKRKSLLPGNVAPDFTMKNDNNADVTLSDVYKANKVTLIDFWASWCSPCRANNAKLVDLYKSYHKKGLEIVGVALEKDGQEWIEASKKDKITWINLSSIEFMSSPVCETYAITYPAQNILVDNNGVILAKNVKYDELVEIIKEKCN